MKFKIDKSVFEKFPKLIVSIPLIYGFDNHKFSEEALSILRTAEKDIKEKLSLESLTKDKRIVSYTDTFKQFGVDPEIKLPAHLALTKRVLEGKEIPDINPMVNLYNAMSIKYLTPFGGEDLDTLYGDFILKMAEGGERWIGIGSKKSKAASKGELVWGDDMDLSTKALNWRQCDRTKLTDDSKNGYFVMDGFENVNKEIIEKAAKEFTEIAVKLFGGTVETIFLSIDQPEAEIDFISKDISKFEVKKIERKIVEKKYYFLAKKIHDYLVSKYPEHKLSLDHPSVDKFGDYSIRADIDIDNNDLIEKTEKVAGFTNIWLKDNILIREAKKILSDEYQQDLKSENNDKKIMVEFAHPNTHKELHVGHMRTLITGEALARLFEATGAKVFRANYQGDIGPHVAKAIWGVQKILNQTNQTITDLETKSNSDKAHFLGKAYALGCSDYETSFEADIDELNQKLYKNDPSIADIYKTTRKWSLDYYDDFYSRFYTKYDKLFFESEVSEAGRKIVMDNAGTIFDKGDEGAIIFDGEKHGLHKRVFITGKGTVTYEGKEMGLAYAQKKEFEYDKNIHVVGNEQAGYFKVVIKAMGLIDPWFEGRQYHLPMGMVTFADRKMSSRTGDIVTVDSILDETTGAILPLLTNEEINKKETAEIITIGAVKFSVLKSDPTQNSIFDIKKSVDLNGNSGPYLQYTYARCQSVINKATKLPESNSEFGFDDNEKLVLRYFYLFSEKVAEAVEKLNPAILAEYLLNLARKYNEFYGKCRIIGEPEEEKRVFLTQVTAKIIKDGLDLLGIKTIEKM